MQWLWFADVLLFSVLYSSSDGCSFPPGKEPPVYTIDQTLTLAPIVVSGTIIRKGFTFDDNHPKDTLQISCVFKSGGNDIPRVSYLLEVGFISCDGTHIETDQSYITALMPAPQSLLDELSIPEAEFGQYFKVFEPDLSNTGAFPATETNLATAAALCGMKDTIISLGDGSPPDHLCPTREVTEETCVQASGAARLANFRTKLFPTKFQLIGTLMSFVLCSLTAVFFVV